MFFFWGGGSHRYLDGLPTTGDASGRAFRDLEWEDKVLKICQEMGIGAQFGGKYFCHDVRVIRVCMNNNCQGYLVIPPEWAYETPVSSIGVMQPWVVKK